MNGFQDDWLRNAVIGLIEDHQSRDEYLGHQADRIQRLEELLQEDRDAREEILSRIQAENQRFEDDPRFSGTSWTGKRRRYGQ